MAAADLTASYLSEARKAELKANAEALLAPGKGILAADEATPAMGQRLASIGTHCLKNTQNVAFELFNFGIFHQVLSY